MSSLTYNWLCGLKQIPKSHRSHQWTTSLIQCRRVQKHKSNLKTQASHRATIQTQALWCLHCHHLPSKTLSGPLLCPVSLGLLSCYPHIARYKAHSVFCVNVLVAGEYDPQKQSISQCFSLDRSFCKFLIIESNMNNSLPVFFVVGLCFVRLCFVL